MKGKVSFLWLLWIRNSTKNSKKKFEQLVIISLTLHDTDTSGKTFKDKYNSSYFRLRNCQPFPF